MTEQLSDFSIFEETESGVRSYCRKYPAVFARAKGSELFDVNGRRYIDFLAVAGSLNYGHNNPEIKKAILDYLLEDRPINMLDMYTEAKADFLDAFRKEILGPRGLDYRVMCCGPTGTNAVEAALKLARKNTGRSGVVAFGGAFHGMTQGALSCTTDRLSRDGAGVPLSFVTHIPFDGTPGLDSLRYLRWILEDDHSGTDKPAAVITETIQAEGGVNVASDEWLKGLSSICKEHGLLLIVDDVQTGCGRTGSFFSFERAKLSPDMVVLSKSISGFGMPMSLLLIKPELDIFRPAEHNGTFRGNQLSFVGGAAGVRYFNRHNLAGSVMEKGELVRDFLNRRVCARDSRIRIRGRGLLWGVDLGGIDPGLALQVVHVAFGKGLICEVAGRGDGVVKIMPPLTIERELLLEGLSIIEESVAEVLSELKGVTDGGTL